MTEYQVIYETAEDGGWGAYSPYVPGCYATGKSKSDVEQLMREAIPMHLETMREADSNAPRSHIA
jgi:predicted RNase H-like HicB family nuclease